MRKEKPFVFRTGKGSIGFGSPKTVNGTLK